MTHPDDASTFAYVLTRFGDDSTEELFGSLLEQALQDLIDAEVTAKIGASWHERTDTRSNYRNENRGRTLSSPSGYEPDSGVVTDRGNPVKYLS